MMKKVEIYTDGACSGNPGKGGWGAILICNGSRKEISGYDEATTNNRMEITGVLSGLRALKEPCDVTVYSDSAYTVDAFRNHWIDAWEKNHWKTANKQPVKNQDLWQALIAEVGRHRVTWVKVKGHSDNELNNRCDALARGEIEQRM